LYFFIYVSIAPQLLDEEIMVFRIGINTLRDATSVATDDLFLSLCAFLLAFLNIRADMPMFLAVTG